MTTEKQMQHLAQTAMFIGAGIPIDAWQTIYDMHGVSCGGFPGIHFEMGLWAVAFEAAVAARDLDSFDYIQAVDEYTADCIRHSTEGHTMPSSQLLETLAAAAIQKYSY